MLRRLAFAISIVWLDFKVSIFQILVSALLSMSILAYLFQRFPMRENYHNWLALYNEAVVYMGTLLMVVFTDYV